MWRTIGDNGLTFGGSSESYNSATLTPIVCELLACEFSSWNSLWLAWATAIGGAYTQSIKVFIHGFAVQCARQSAGDQARRHQSTFARGSYAGLKLNGASTRSWHTCLLIVTSILIIAPVVTAWRCFDLAACSLSKRNELGLMRTVYHNCNSVTTLLQFGNDSANQLW